MKIKKFCTKFLKIFKSRTSYDVVYFPMTLKQIQIKHEKLFRKMVKILSFIFVVQEIWVFIFLVTSSIWRLANSLNQGNNRILWTREIIDRAMPLKGLGTLNMDYKGGQVYYVFWLSVERRILLTFKVYIYIYWRKHNFFLQIQERN